MQNISPNSQGPFLPSLGSANPSQAPQNPNIRIQGRRPSEALPFTHPSSSSNVSPVCPLGQIGNLSSFRRSITSLHVGDSQLNLPSPSSATACANKVSSVANQTLIEKSREDDEAIIKAVKTGSLKDLQSFVDSEYCFDTFFEDQETKTKRCNLLHIAALHGQHTLFEFLLDQGLDINALNGKKQTPLHCAINSPQSDRELIQKLLEEGADPNLVNIYKKTPLEQAIKAKKLGWIVPLLTAKQFDLKKNLNESLAKTLQAAPLYFFQAFIECTRAASLSETEEIQKIIEFQDFFLKNLLKKIGYDSRFPGLRYCDIQNRVNKLFANYFQAPHKNLLFADSAGNTLLHLFASSFKPAFFSDICYGFNLYSKEPGQFKELINKTNLEGNTAFNIYIENLIQQKSFPSLNHWEDLSELGFNILIPNNKGNNFLHFFAERKEFYDLCSKFLDKRALSLLFCQKNQNGESPYSIAKKQNTHFDFLKALFSSESDFQNSIHICIQYGLDEALSDIVRKQQQILSPNLFENWINGSYEGVPFLFQCVNYKNLEALKILLSAGAKWEIYDEDLRSLAYHMLKQNFIAGLQELVALAKTTNRDDSAFFEVGLGKKHLIFDAIRLKKYDLIPLLFIEAEGYEAEEVEMITPIHALSYSPEDCHFLEKLLKESKNRLSPETFSLLINDSLLPDTFCTPLELAAAQNNFKTAILLQSYGASPPRNIDRIYQTAISKGHKDKYSCFFTEVFLTQLIGSKSSEYIMSDKTVDYDSLPGAVFLHFLLTPKEVKAKVQIEEQNYGKCVEKSFKQINGILKAIDENIFNSIGAQKFGSGVKTKVQNAFLKLYQATRERQASLGTYNASQDEYLHKQYYAELVGCLSDIADALEKEADLRSRALTLLEIATPDIEGRCMGATREEILSAWRLLKQNEGENLSGFRNHLDTLLRDVLNTQAQLFAQNIMTLNDPSIPEQARAPGEQVHHYNQLLYLLGLTSVPEPTAVCKFSPSEIMGRFILHLGESDRWLIDPFLNMVKKKNLANEMTSWIEDFIRKDLNCDPKFLQRKQQVKEFLQEADKTRFDAIFKELANETQTKEAIAFFHSYRSENLAPSVLVRTLQKRLQKLSSGKRAREEDVTSDQDLLSSKKTKTQEGAKKAEQPLEVEEKWKKILAADKAWQESLSEFALLEEIQYSPFRNESLEQALFETVKSERLFSLADDDCLITTEKAARYLLKHLKILRSQ